MVIVHLCGFIPAHFSRVEVDQRWHWQYTVCTGPVLMLLIVAEEGGLHNDAWCTAFGDLLHSLPIIGMLDCIHNVILIRKSTLLKLGEDQLPVDLNLKAALSSHEA